MSQETSGNDIADRRFEMASQLNARGEAQAAIDLLEQTLDLVPDWLPLHFRLGEIHMEIGNRDEAVKFFTHCLTLDASDRFGAIVKLALLGATPKLHNLPAGYVEGLFDDYAPRFDSALLKNLGYRVPWILADAVESIRPYRADMPERILDLGCGTGLSGEAFAHRASWLEGVDMSAGMLAQAEIKKIYHYLAHDDVVSFLNQTQKEYDIIIAADVLVYMGKLEALFEAVDNRLSSGGIFVFSTQILDQGSYLLGHDHRYSHSGEYVQSCASVCAMNLLCREQAFIRHDGANDIYGQIAIFEKPNLQKISIPPYVVSKTNSRKMRRKH